MLPVDVLLPTRDSMAYLPGHLRSAAAWLDAVEQIVVVDSHSKDGTVEFIKANLRHPNLHILSHPPGLYESWNHGIANLQTRFTYISTIGDTISRAGLEHLAASAELLQCDVLVSPPEFVEMPDGPPAPRRWPIHELLRDLHIESPQVLDHVTVFFYACLHTFGPHFSSLLGSSASNLYRTSVLQKFPFPTNLGRSGDTGWSFLHSVDARLGVTPRPCATFLSHAKPVAPGADFYSKVSEQLFVEVLPSVRRQLDTDPESKAACSLVQMDAFLEELRKSCHQHAILRKSRESQLAWYLNPRAWAARVRRARWRRKIESFKGRIKTLHASHQIDASPSRLANSAAPGKS